MTTLNGIVVFDLDGTLVDTTDAHVMSFSRAFQEMGYEPPSCEQIRGLLGKPGPDIIRSLMPRLSEDEITRISQRKRKIFREDLVALVKPLPYVKQVIQEIGKKFHLAIASNSVTDLISLILESAGIDPNLFRVMAGPDTVKNLSLIHI